MKKRFLSLMLVLAMMVGVFTPLIANAADAEHKTKVNIHKILMKEHNWNAKKVTLTKTTDPKTSESKVIIEKEKEVEEHGEKKKVKEYYDGADPTNKLDETNEFVKAFKGETVTGKTKTETPVFPGKSGLDGTEFKGQELNIEKYFGSDSKPINGVAFRIFEVYKGTENAPADYKKGSELTTTYKLAEGDLVATKYYKLVTEGATDGVFTTTTVERTKGIATATLKDGEYRIVEDKAKSTYKGENGETLTGMKAVPFDLVLPIGKPDGSGDYSEKDPLNVYPKNTEKKVKFDKNFAKDNGLEKITDPNKLKDVGAVFDNYEKEKANAEAEIGKEIKYEAKAFLPKGSIYKNLHLADSMDNGLKYDSKTGVKVTVTPTLNPALVAETDYKVKTVGNGFDITFEQAGLDKLNKAAENADVEITFTYSAHVTSEAVVDKPMDNHATFTYNHTPPKPSSDNVKPVNKEIKVEKTWADGKAPTGIKVKYVLLDENDKALADITFDGANKVVDDEDKNQITDLGHGFKFKRTGDFAGTFQGLEENKEYKVKEIVDGYEPEYIIEATKGEVTVKNTKTPESITPTPPQVTVGGKKFVKLAEGTDDRLAGAQFVIENQDKVTKVVNKQETLVDGPNYGKYLKINEATGSTAYTDAAKAYNDAIEAVNKALAKGEISATNKVTIGTDTFDTKDKALAKVAGLQKTRDEAFVTANLNYTWVDKQEDATQFFTNKDGQFEVYGIAYGNYRAVERKAAPGFALDTNKENFKFVVNKGSYAGNNTEYKYEAKLEKDQKQTYGKRIDNKKVTIPETGGIGTIIFTAIGLAIMASAVIAIKKRQATEAR
ncbi:cell wall anchor protein [Finegoldia magna ALB8]|uniref:pilin N-terminal domain-containing protein n=1 Tax=Finegoldia magna TaxID=1260 RepID=UPI0004516709|nr:pilin N-terminal domain-containing protein [Finegoldia magna]EXF27719.1 cell wall anchor protein [Finegoldia magna ALB8]